MGCCNDKNKHHHHHHHNHHGLPDKFVDLSCMKTTEWDEVPTVIGLTECGHVVPVDKPLHELTGEDRDKLNAVHIGAEGKNALYDDGTYKETYTKEQAQQAINSSLEDAVFYDQENNINPRADILLANGQQLFGKSNVGGKHNIAQVTTSNVINVGDPTLDYHINSLARPKVKAYTPDGYVVNEVAYKAEVEALKEKGEDTHTDLSSLENRVADNEKNIQDNKENIAQNATNIAKNAADITDIRSNLSANGSDLSAVDTRLTTAEENIQANADSISSLRTATQEAFDEVGESIDELDSKIIQNSKDIAGNASQIETLREDLASRELFRGYYETIAQVTRIKNPAEGNYAWCAESGTVWIYNGTTWFNSTTPIPDQTVEAYEAAPRMDGEGDAGSSNRYARGDHQHPSDESKANTADLDNYLPLEGNTQANRITGDIWISTGQSLKLTNSGNSYLAQDAESNTTQLVGNSVGGIDLVAPNGTIKANGDRIITETEYNNSLADISTLQTNASEKEQDILALDTRIATAEENIEANATTISSLETATDEALDTVNQSLSDHNTRISQNAASIAGNTSDIETLREDLASRELFRGYYEAITEVTAIKSPVEGNYAWCAETGTVWMHNGETWLNSNTPIPDQTVEAYDAAPRMDGAGDAGATNRYARGDHQHPSDDTKANITDLDNYLALSGNNQASRISGDIWITTGQQIKLTNSGTTYLGQDTDDNTTNLVGNGAGGINIQAPNGPVKVNGDRVVTEAEHNNALADITALQSDIQNNANLVSELRSDVDINILSITDLSTSTEAAFHTVNQSLNDHDGRISQNAANIAGNASEIETLREDLASRELFRGYYETIDEVTAIKNPVEGNYAWCAETGTVWMHNGETWLNSNTPIPDQTVEAYDAAPRMDGVGDAGITNRYARGDHQHPSDDAKANITDLDNYLALSGNSQTTRISGDIWITTGQKVRLSNSGNSSIGQGDNNNTEIVNSGVGGIDLNTPNSTAKYNGVEIATVDDIANISGDLSNVSGSLSTLSDTVSSIDGRVAQNEADITDLQQALEATEHFRGYFATTAEITTLSGGAGDFAWNGHTGTVWVYNTSIPSWVDSEEPIPAETPYDALPQMDGTADAGNTTAYSRGNHVHPTDTSRASVEALTTLESTVSEQGEQLSTAGISIAALQSAVSEHTTDIAVVQNTVNNHGERISAAEENITGLTSDVSSHASNIAVIEAKVSNQGERIATAESNITGLQSDVASHTSDLAVVQNTVSNHSDRIAATEENVSTLQSDVSSHASDIAVIENKVSNQGERIATAESNITALQSDLASNASDVAVLQSTVSEQGSRLTTAEGQIVTINANLSATQTSLSDYVASNDPRVSTLETNVYDLQGRTSASESAITTLQGNVITNSADIQELVGNVSSNTTAICTLKSGVLAATQDIAGLDIRVSENESGIALNASDIQSILDKLAAQEKFRGYYQTTSEVTDIANPEPGDYAWNGETNTVWIYNGITWANSHQALPDVIVTASDAKPLIDGEAEAGESNEYARGDHRHPTDISRASAADLTTLENTVSTISGKVDDLRTDVDENTSGVSANASAISTLQSNLSTAQNDISDLQSSVAGNEADIAAVTNRVSTAEGHISAIQDTLDTVQSDVATNTGDIATLKTNYSELEANLTEVEESLSDYLPLAGGTVTGDLKVEGQFNYPAVELTASDDINTLLTPGRYVFVAGIKTAGTFPSDFSETTAATLVVYEYSPLTSFQVMYQINRMWYRTIGNATRGWSLVATGDYLPLSGGTVTGDLTVEGQFNYPSVELTASDNIDQLLTIGDFYIQGSTVVGGTFPSGYSITSSSFIKVLNIGVNRVQLFYNNDTLWNRSVYSSGNTPPTTWVRGAKTTDLDSYLPLSGGQLTGDLGLGVANVIRFADLDTGSSQIGYKSGVGVQLLGSSSNVKLDNDITLRTQSSVGNINLNTQLGGIATYNEEEIATKVDIENIGIENYLPLAGGTVTGDLKVDGQLINNGLLLTSADNIDTLVTPGIYYAPTPVAEGTFPANSTNNNTIVVQVFKIDRYAVRQVLWQYHRMWTRTITNDSIVVDWTEFLTDVNSNFLSLEGGTITGDLNINGLASYKGLEVATVADIPEVPENLNGLVPSNIRLDAGRIYRLATSTHRYGTLSALITAGVDNSIRRTVEITAFDNESSSTLMVREVFNPGGSTADINSYTFWYRLNDEGKLEVFIKNEAETTMVAGVNVLQYRSFIPEGFVLEPTSLTTDELTNLPIHYVEHLSKSRGGNITGTTTYKGNEIATTNQLPSISIGKATSQGSATVSDIPSGASIMSVNYNRLMLFESDYTYSGNAVTVTNTEITGSMESTDKIEVTYLNV